MQSSCVLILLLGSPFVVEAGAARGGLSPISRVVELLQALSKKIEEEGRKEEDLYEGYVCWAKSVVDTKTASNTAAQSRIDELNAYINDVDNGRVEFTSERADLEKEIDGLQKDILNAKNLRAKEHEDFLAAQDEMKKAIAALEKAVTVLGEATAEAKSGVLLSVKAQMNEGYKERQADGEALSHAIEVGKNYLSKGDALFLERVLSGEVPTVDWKKLNRKATFKMKYKARSFKIQDVLAKLLETFNTNLKEAEDTEAAAEEAHEKLMKSKGSMLEEAQNARAEMAGETAARGKSMEESRTEVGNLETQIENDKKYIEQTQKSLADMKGQWKERKALRAGEIAAVSKAISVLNNDDARDNFKKSFKSQGYLLLQERTSVAVARQAGSVLRTVAKKSGDRRLLALAMRVALQSTGHFDDVINAIDEMIEVLKEEGKTDYAQKEECEDDRSTNSRKAALSSRDIDEATDKITKLTAEIKEIMAEIEEKEAAVAELEKQLKEAQENRNLENAEWESSNAVDKAAAETVANAKEVLESFYKENKLVLVQGREVPLVAGKAPPPPPKTWEAPYGGKTDESMGILAIMDMIHEDINMDIEKAKQEEEQAQTDFEAFKKDNENTQEQLRKAIQDLNNDKGEKEGTVQETKDARLSAKKELDITMKTLKDLAAGCDFIAVNFPLRAQNRAIEIDGLSKAKAILQGAAFSTVDPNREIKPGDAFLQRRA